MITLILNSMEGPMQLVLAKSEPGRHGELSVVDALSWEPEGQGAETLIPNLSELIKKNDLSPAAVKRIACVRGPGSFTGIRLALTTALGLSRSIPGGPALAGLDYLPLLAATVMAENNIPTPASVWVLTHARRGQVHIQGFAAGPGLSALQDARGCLIDNAVETIKQQSRQNTPIYLLGTGLARNLEQFATALPEAVCLEGQAFPSIKVLTRAAGLAKYSHEPIEPLYLRASDAEENLPYIAAGLGLDPHQAMLDLLKLTGRNH